MTQATRIAIETGTQFGKWVVVKTAESTTKHRRWLCSCECGTTRNVREDVLRNGVSTSCGCSRNPVRLGAKFGRLTVLQAGRPATDGRSRWLCKCDCGTVTTIRTGGLTSGRTTSCGCYGRQAAARKGVYRVDHPTYRNMHKRVEAKRGPAANHPCVDCGGPAKEWSYDHLDRHELVETIKTFPMRYSASVDHYDARCIDCHRVHDGAAGFA